MSEIKVRVGDREMTLAEAEQTMDRQIADFTRRDHPAWNSQEGAQAFVDAYAQEHQKAHGQPWTGQA